MTETITEITELEKAKPTPGPWNIHRAFKGEQLEIPANEHREGYHFWQLYVGQGDKIIACLTADTNKDGGGFPSVDNLEELQANTRLVAAVPSLYEFVKKLADSGDIDAINTLQQSNLS